MAFPDFRSWLDAARTNRSAPITRPWIPTGTQAPRPTPIGDGPRRWHLRLWKKEGLMDELLDEDNYEPGTNGWDLVNNLITQAGNVYSTRAGGIVTRPRPGQIVPAGSPVPGTTFGVSNSLLLAGVAALGAFLILKKK